MKKKYIGLQGLRGLGSLGIIAYHIYVLNGYSGINSFTDRTLGNGGVFVQLFFILSSFSLLCGYFSEFNEKADLEKFYFTRIRKLVPTFWIALLFHVVIDYVVKTPLNFSSILGTASLLFALMPQYQESMVMAGWALGIEIVFYLFFPAFFVFVKNKKRSWITLAFSFLLFDIYIKYYGVGVYQDYINIIRQLIFFTVGAVLFHYTDDIGNLTKKARWMLFVFCILLEIFCFLFYGKINGYLIIVLAFSAVIMNQINFKDPIVNNPVFRFLGRISYQIYLFHMVVYKVLYNVGFFVKTNHLQNIYVRYLIQYTVVVGITVLLSWIINIILNKIHKFISTKTAENHGNVIKKNN